MDLSELGNAIDSLAIAEANIAVATGGQGLPQRAGAIVPQNVQQLADEAVTARTRVITALGKLALEFNTLTKRVKALETGGGGSSPAGLAPHVG